MTTWESHLRFVDEGEPLLGTGGAVRFAVEQAAIEHPFFVLYGDSYLRVDLRAVSDSFEERQPEALMTVFRNDGAWDTSNVIFDGRCVLRYDKHEPDPASAGMHYIDYGLSVLRPTLGVGANPAATTGRTGRPVPYTQPRRPTGGIRGPAAILRDRIPGWHRRLAPPPAFP